MSADELRPGHSNAETQSAAQPTGTPPPGIRSARADALHDQDTGLAGFWELWPRHVASGGVSNDHFNAQVKENTVAVDIGLLLKQAKPRDADAADRAVQIHVQVCDSGHLTLPLDELTTQIDGKSVNEMAAHPGVQHLLGICARAVCAGVSVLDPDHPVRQQTLLLQSFDQCDYVPAGADNSFWPDIAVTAREVPADGYTAPTPPTGWEDIAAGIRVKRARTPSTTGSELSPDALDKMCDQLARCAVNMITIQPNRRFAWSVFTIHTCAYVCLFGRDRIYRAKAIDLGTLAGRQQLAQFVVYWSLAGPAQFGLDPTLYYDPVVDHWVIECFDDADATPTKREYYAKDNTVFIRPSLFGRRTVTFSASAQRGGDATVYIKDAWPVSTPDATGHDPHSEATLLRLMDVHCSKHGPGVLYPKLVLGGSVWQGGHGGLEHDDTRLAHGAIDDALRLPDADSPSPVYRVHRRMVMTPLAERLDTLDNFNGLIKVLADVMACHRQLYDECSIFHQDTSTTNIMVVRQGSAVRGMLVDFDNAIRLSADFSDRQPERTGTLPLMSIGNLENNDTARTALDDWVSLLYVICWVGTYGFKPESSAKSTEPAAPKPKLHRWLEGSMEDAASEKRFRMGSPDTAGRIVGCFQPLAGVSNLQDLTLELHLALFQYHECPGAILVGPRLLQLRRLAANSGSSYDPLKARANYQHEVVNNCHKALQAAREALDQPKGKKPRT
ncbi:hypothetical protein H4R35_000732 [Dimargaris xerosporica]|nr:hypothetical protein H4R35_000732 [Dimargaris xerosporica]